MKYQDFWNKIKDEMEEIFGEVTEEEKIIDLEDYGTTNKIIKAEYLGEEVMFCEVESNPGDMALVAVRFDDKGEEVYSYCLFEDIEKNFKKDDVEKVIEKIEEIMNEIEASDIERTYNDNEDYYLSDEDNDYYDDYEREDY